MWNSRLVKCGMGKCGLQSLVGSKMSDSETRKARERINGFWYDGRTIHRTWVPCVGQSKVQDEPFVIPEVKETILR